MKRLLAAILGVVGLASASYAQFSMVGIGNPTYSPPPGTSLIQIDGGSNYYGRNGFTTATLPLTFNGVSYTSGWDSPGWRPMGWFLEFGCNSTDFAKWVAANTNMTVASVTCSGQLSAMGADSIGLLIDYRSINQTQTTDQPIGNETVGIFTYDEPPTWEAGMRQQIEAMPPVTFTGWAGAFGVTASQVANVVTFSGMTATQTIENAGQTLSGGGFTSETISYFTGTGTTGTYPLSASTTSFSGAITFSPSGASGTGTITNNVLNMTAVTGTIANGDTLSGTGITGGTTVALTGLGTSGNGKYQGSVSQTASGTPNVAGESMHRTSGLVPTDVPILCQAGAYATLMAQPPPAFYDGGVNIPSNQWLCDQQISESTGTANYFMNFGNGLSVPSETVTQQATGLSASYLDTRFVETNLTAAHLVAGGIGSTLCQVYGAAAPYPCNGGNSPMNYILSTPRLTRSGRLRTPGIISVDIYPIVGARCQGLSGFGGCLTAMDNLYANTGVLAQAWTEAQMARGPHYGDMIDRLRSFYTLNSDGSSPNPVWNVLETGNCRCGVPYDITPVEYQWALWSGIIHGDRGVILFGQVGQNSPDNCSGGQLGDSIYCNYMNSTQTMTVTNTNGSSISGNVLTVTSADSVTNGTINNVAGQARGGSGVLAPGQRSASGVSGGPVTILQQTQYGSLAAPTGTVTFSSGTNQTSVTVSGLTGTISLPALVIGPFASFGALPQDGLTSVVLTSGSGGNGTYTTTAYSMTNGFTAGSYAATFQPVAMFTVQFLTNNTSTQLATVAITSTSGKIEIPSIMIGQGVNNRLFAIANGSMNIRQQNSGTANGNGNYTVDAFDSVDFGTPGTYTNIIAVPAPGGVGTYLLDKSGATTTGTMTFTQSGWACSAGAGPGGSNCGPGGLSQGSGVSMINALTSTNGLALNLGPVINSSFMKGFLASQSPDRYMYERGFTTQNCGTGTNTQPLMSHTCGWYAGLDSMVKYYQGSTFTASSGESITPGPYLFATTNAPETQTNISATFNLVSACGVSTATVIGESRSIAINNCSFNDTFAYAWTTHIYQLH